MADIQQLLSVLDVFGRAPDREALEKANAWLQDFQHSADAWNSCSVLLSSPDAPPAAKVFAAQTFRTKITYDLNQVAPNEIFALRDTLLAALQAYKNGPRSIIVQLSLALAGLAVQLPTWGNAVQMMIEHFGQNPDTVPLLLEFLTVLPEEINNYRIPITDDEYRERVPQLLTENVPQILNLLAVYIQAQGVTMVVQNQVFRCLRAWLTAGEISASALVATPLFDFVWEALASEELFDAAVEVACDVIHETQEVDDNMPVIERIMPHVIALRPALVQHKEDPERVRGYARVFAEAGECYRSLILHHTQAFFPLVEAILECASYPDLDIVPITFPFWERLAHIIGKRTDTAVDPLFRSAYTTLMRIVISHLHFPADGTTLTGQALDDFRNFRHVMGDTLKDCCLVLGVEPCLSAALDMVGAALGKGAQAAWQEVEAPLFAMRSMGAELDPTEESAVPRIMEIIPLLPNHQRVRYAALLLLSRYTRWINSHPQFVQPTLQYISSGLEAKDLDVCAAAGHAMRYLCEDCKRHLVAFLPQLHAFMTTLGPRLDQEDRKVVYEAIAHVISAMPMEQAAQSLRTFALELLGNVHQLTSSTKTVTRPELTAVCDSLTNLEVMIYTVGPFGESLPEACAGTCEEAWAVLDAFILKYGNEADPAEVVTRVLRQGTLLFGNAGLGVAPAVVARMAAAFEATGLASYLWISGKLLQAYGNEEAPALRPAFRDAFERLTKKMSLMLTETQPALMPDVLDDFVRMFIQWIEYAPDVTFESPAFLFAFRSTLAALTLLPSDIIVAALDFLVMLFEHDCLSPPDALNPPPPKYPGYARAINAVLETEGANLVLLLLQGVTGDFPEDTSGMTIAIFRRLAAIWPQHLLQWLPPALQGLPTATTPDDTKTRFLNDVTDAINQGHPDKVKYAILGIHRTSRKQRDRRRIGPGDIAR
ncbi:unnamed protein product [Peniophora sp. CBMAI 1063]|nr:unnamed protein product [Peniophora sp. CBMAI 1063]